MIRRPARPTCALLPALLLALAFPASRAAGRPSAPADEELPALAASLAERIWAARVTLPDGSSVNLLGPSDADHGEAGAPEALLTPQRLEICLRTVSEAEAWPAAWLVVQEARRDFDLVMRIELNEAGGVAAPVFLFTVPRREWEIDDIKPVVREATGRKPPRKGIGNLVIQGFSKRIVTTYVYEPAPAGEGARGLAGLLPEGSLIRESRAVDLGDGKRYTLALVLRDAIFEPSSCGDCSAELFGHADSGRVILVLADPAAIVDQIDLSPQLSGLQGRPLLPRYRCEPGDADRQPPIESFGKREPVSLIELTDLDGDGQALEITLPAEPIDCARHLALAARIDPGGPTLEIVGLRAAASR